MKILVTGANGYIGMGVVKRLYEDGIDVIATDLKTDNILQGVNKISCNIFEVQNPFEEFGKPDVLLHLAWRNGFVHNAETHITDLPMHFQFIKKMVDAGCGHIAVMGTMHEIGFYEGCIKEDTPANPESLYGISKNALRNATKLLCNNKTIFQWLRGYYIVGNSEYGSSIFSKITCAEKKGQELFPFTMGMNQWDFIDYDDLCIQIASAVEQNVINGVINICSGRPEKLAERVERFIKDNQYKIKLDYGKYPDRPYDSKAVWGDDNKIRQIMLKKSLSNNGE